jgi:rare lipoprotein A
MSPPSPFVLSRAREASPVASPFVLSRAREASPCRRSAFVLALLGSCAAPATLHATPPATAGDATWYSDSLAGGPTASGERYDPGALTAAHRTLPLGTVVRVTRVDTGASVVVRINDRGPFGRRRRIIDLSRAAATRLSMIRRGVAPVRLEIIRLGEGRTRRRFRRR